MYPEGYHEYRGVFSTKEGTQITEKILSPTVLNTPHGTQDIPHMHHGIPHGTDHPHGTAHPNGNAHTLYRVRLLAFQRLIIIHLC